MRIKICGLCRPEDALLAVAAGADLGGVILAGRSRRLQRPERAERIYAALTPAQRVGVFVDAPEGEVCALARRFRLAVVQLHGREPPAVAQRLGTAGPWQIWKALRLRSREDLLLGVERYAGRVRGLLLDSWSERAAGGTGRPFAWTEVAAVRDQLPAGLELIVAGGLNPENVAAAIELLRPDVVDVSSGVEQSVGEKSPQRVRAFVAAARAAAGGWASRRVEG